MFKIHKKSNKKQSKILQFKKKLREHQIHLYSELSKLHLVLMEGSLNQPEILMSRMLN